MALWQRLQLLTHRVASLLAKGGSDATPTDWKRPELWKATEGVELGSGLPQVSGVDERIAVATSMALGGVIASVDEAAGLFTLQTGEPYPSTAGTELWQQYAANLESASAQTRFRLQTVQRWQKEGSPKQFQVAPYTLIMRNGEVATLSSLKIGDSVGLRFRATRAGMEAVGVDWMLAVDPRLGK